MVPQSETTVCARRASAVSENHGNPRNRGICHRPGPERSIVVDPGVFSYLPSSFSSKDFFFCGLQSLYGRQKTRFYFLLRSYFCGSFTCTVQPSEKLLGIVVTIPFALRPMEAKNSGPSTACVDSAQKKNIKRYFVTRILFLKEQVRLARFELHVSRSKVQLFIIQVFSNSPYVSLQTGV